MAAFSCLPALKQKWHNEDHMEALRRISTGATITIITAVGAGLLALALLAVWSTTPPKLGPLGVTVWFVMLFGGLAGVGTIVLYGAKRYLQLHGNPSSRLRYSLRQALLAAAVAVCALGLSSLGQLTWRDTVLLVLFATLVELYARLRWP